VTVDAFHLPGQSGRSWQEWESAPLGGNGDEVRWPVLDAAAVRSIAGSLRAAGAALKALPLREIIDAVEQATAKLFDDPESAARLAAQVAAATGYSVPMARSVLERMAADWRAGPLMRLVEAELGDPSLLDGFATVNGRQAHASGAPLAVHIFSGNVPGVAVTSMIRSLLVKSPVLGKTAAGERILAPAFARALSAIHPVLGAAIAVVYWEGGNHALEDAAFAQAEIVVHYGGRDALQEVSRRIPPGTRLIEHGPRISFGMVGRDALAHGDVATLARDVAYAVGMFDQQGCVSPHVVFVEDGGDTTPRAFARAAADALHALEDSMPPGPVSPAYAAAIRRVRDAAEFRAIGGQDVDVWGSAALGHTVVYDTTPSFDASCLGRTITFHPVAALSDVIPLVRPYRSVLQSVALAVGTPRLDELRIPLAHAGISRITTFESLPWPPFHWHHDGRGPLLELLEWTDLES
jgi:hypothetical protein